MFYSIIALVWLLGYHPSDSVSQAQSCNNGTVRLVDGADPYEGRVEICLFGVWRTVCDDEWNNNAARATCRQLGYLTENATALDEAFYGEGKGPIVRVSCQGTERRLTDCNYIDYDSYPYCQHIEDAGARCQTFCLTEGEIRLHGRANRIGAQFVELCLNGTWGHVCDNHWDTNDASVVCKQLGYSRFESKPVSGSNFVSHTNSIAFTIHLGDMACTGNEQRLIECSHTKNIACPSTSFFIFHCGPSTRVILPLWSHAAVTCQQTLRCQDGEVKLVGGSTLNEGQVEVCINETWSAICNNHSDLLDATVCRQLGYSNYAVPLDFEAMLDQSNNCTLTWLPPVIARHGNISKYLVNCSAKDDVKTINTMSNALLVTLRPHTKYYCCVLAISEFGVGHPVCKTLVTFESVPSSYPTNIETYSLNSTSLFLTWTPPLEKYRNGIIRDYHVQLVEVNTTTELNYTTHEPHLIINDLKQDVTYTCKIAAITTGPGPFSKPINIINPLENNSLTPPESTLAAVCGVLLLLVLASLTVHVATCIYCRNHKHQKESPNTSHTATFPVYEMVDTTMMDSSNNPSDSTIVDNEHQQYYSNHLTSFDSTSSQTSHTANAQLHPHNTARETANEENPYQPLVLKQATASSEYQLLSQLATTKATLMSTEYQTLSQLTTEESDDSPPPIPPKPNEL